MSRHLITLDAVFWRMLRCDWAEDVTCAARAPEGRSHYGGQPALYLSQTPAGCVVATARYLQPEAPRRAIYPLRVQGDRFIDLRDAAATAHFGIDTTHRAAAWQDIRATGARSPTWDISDAVRRLALHGMLYASRTQPDITHLTLFDWNSPTGAVVTPEGAPIPQNDSLG